MAFVKFFDTFSGKSRENTSILMKIKHLPKSQETPENFTLFYNHYKKQAA